MLIESFSFSIKCVPGEQLIPVDGLVDREQQIRALVCQPRGPGSIAGMAYQSQL